jgi:hypothetical protein
MGTNVFSAPLIDSSRFEFGGGHHDLAHHIGAGVTRFGIAAEASVPPPSGYTMALPFTGSAIALAGP